MICVQEDVCWLVAKLTNVTAAKRDLMIKNLSLVVNPEFESFIEAVPNKMFDDLKEAVVKPGEHFSCSFKLNIGKIPANLDISDLLSSLSLQP